jgi:hypothetical protein
MKDLFRPAPFLENGDADQGMFFGGRMLFVVEVMDETRYAPEIFVFPAAASVGTHGGFYGQHVFNKVFVLCVLAEERHRIIT